MKPWLITISILLLLVGVVVGLLQSAEVQYRIAEHYYNNGDNDTAFAWAYPAGIKGYEEAQKIALNFATSNTVEPKKLIIMYNWVYSDDYKKMNIEVLEDKALNGKYDMQMFLAIQFLSDNPKKRDLVKGVAWLKVFKETDAGKNGTGPIVLAEMVKYAESLMTSDELKQSVVYHERIVAKIKANQEKVTVEE